MCVKVWIICLKWYFFRLLSNSQETWLALFSMHIVPIIYTAPFDFREKEQAGNNTVLSNVFQIILAVFWNKLKAPSEVCEWAWGRSKVDMPWVRRQLLAPCLPLSWTQDTATIPKRCKCSWLPWLGLPACYIHTALILVPLNLRFYILLIVCVVITSWASQEVVRTRCWQQWCSLPLWLALGKSGGTWEAFGRGHTAVVSLW